MRLRVIPAAADSSLGSRPGLDRVISLTVPLRGARPDADASGRIRDRASGRDERGEDVDLPGGRRPG
jgi:hypothetical protein